MAMHILCGFVLVVVFGCLLQGTGFFEYAINFREKRRTAKAFKPYVAATGTPQAATSAAAPVAHKAPEKELLAA